MLAWMTVPTGCEVSMAHCASPLLLNSACLRWGSGEKTCLLCFLARKKNSTQPCTVQLT